MVSTPVIGSMKQKVFMLVRSFILTSVLISSWGGGVRQVQAEVGTFAIPFWRVSEEPGAAQVVSVALGLHAQELFQGERFLLFTSAVVPDSVDQQAVTVVSLPIMAETSDTLTVSSELSRPSTSPRHEWSRGLRVWYKVEPSSEPVLQCDKVRAINWLAADGSWLGGMAIACDCLSDASPLGVPNSMSIEVDSLRNVSIDWPPLINADAYGVIVWRRAPVGEDLLGAILFVGEQLPSDALGYQFDLPEPCMDGGCFVGVWSRHDGVMDAACYPEIWPYYQLEISSLNLPTVVGVSSWGVMKKGE